MIHARDVANLEGVLPDTLWVRVLHYFCALESGVVVTHRELIDLCYRGRKDGGPHCDVYQIRNFIMRIRKRLLPGWQIITVIDGGYRLVREEIRKAA